MKRSLKQIFLVSVLAVTILSVNFKEAKTNSAAPPAGGLSGDPSRTTCAIIGCHTGTTLTFGAGQLIMNMGLTDSSLSDINGQTYTPGQTYYIEFKPLATNGSRTRYGFQMTSLDASGNMQGSFNVLDASRNSAQSLLSRNYIGHSTANLNNDWIFQWVAPAANAGPVTFYYASNVANNDGINSGDNIYTGAITLNPSTSAGLQVFNKPVEALTLYPNPARDVVFLSFYNETETIAQMTLLDLEGREVQSLIHNIATGVSNSLQFNIADGVSPGIYLLQLQVGTRVSTSRIVKL